MELIYGTVRTDLGDRLTEELVFIDIANQSLSANTTLNFKLFESTLLDNQTSALWNDPIYGFNNYQNFARWSAFNEGA